MSLGPQEAGCDAGAGAKLELRWEAAGNPMKSKVDTPASLFLPFAFCWCFPLTKIEWKLWASSGGKGRRLLEDEANRD